MVNTFAGHIKQLIISKISHNKIAVLTEGRVLYSFHSGLKFDTLHFAYSFTGLKFDNKSGNIFYAGKTDATVWIYLYIGQNTFRF